MQSVQKEVVVYPVTALLLSPASCDCAGLHCAISCQLDLPTQSQSAFFSVCSCLPRVVICELELGL